MGRAGDSRVGRRLVAFQMHEADVVGIGVMDRRGAGGQSLFGGEHGGHDLVFDFDQLQRIKRLIAGLCDHEGHEIADPAHAVSGEAGQRRGVDGRAVALFLARGQRQRAKARISPILMGEHGEHAGGCFGARCIEFQDFCVGVR